MAELAYALETQWLQIHLKAGVDVLFRTEADEGMEQGGTDRTQVVAFLTQNPITSSEREDGCWIWTVEGLDTDERYMWVVISFETSALVVEVVEVGR